MQKVVLRGDWEERIVGESTDSNTELSEFFGPHRVLGREPYELGGGGGELTEFFFAELAKFGAELSKFGAETT